MKTKLILAMSAALAIGIAACGGDDKDDDDTPTVTDAGITVTDSGITVSDGGNQTPGDITTDASVTTPDAGDITQDAGDTTEDAGPHDAGDFPPPDPPTGIAKIVISQIKLGSITADSETYDHDYVELFNAGDTTVNLKNYEFLYGGKSGQVTLATQFADLTGCANDGCKVAAGQYFLMQIKTSHSGEGISAVPFDLDLEGTPNIGANGTFGIAEVSSGLQAASSCADVKAKALDMVGIGENTCSDHPATGISGNQQDPGNRGTKVYMRKGAGCTDTDNDSADFEVADPNPRNRDSDTYNCNAE